MPSDPQMPKDEVTIILAEYKSLIPNQLRNATDETVHS
jgi:hypothetical protein